MNLYLNDLPIMEKENMDLGFVGFFVLVWFGLVWFGFGFVFVLAGRVEI